MIFLIDRTPGQECCIALSDNYRNQLNSIDMAYFLKFGVHLEEVDRATYARLMKELEDR